MSLLPIDYRFEVLLFFFSSFYLFYDSLFRSGDFCFEDDDEDELLLLLGINR